LIRYRLDDLGWYQFEWLVQSLLKAELGIGIESWGGSCDHGKDAFCPSPLKYPARDCSNEGPFIFQVKFIEEANAPSAKSGPHLLSAVRKECDQIQRKRNKGEWRDPRYYILITNVQLSAPLRQSLNEIIRVRLFWNRWILAQFGPGLQSDAALSDLRTWHRTA